MAAWLTLCAHRCWSQDPDDRPTFSGLATKLQGVLAEVDPSENAHVPSLFYGDTEGNPLGAAP